jgi:DNA-binding transcriptional MerR regulator
MTYPLARRRPDVLLLDLESLAGTAGMHPQHVRRLVALGLLEPARAVDGELRFPPSEVLALARIQRLRVGLGINYAALGLVLDLLDRVAALESELHTTGARDRRPPPLLSDHANRGDHAPPGTRRA